jgi:hypothetical protein
VKILWWDQFILKVEELGNPNSAARFCRVPPNEMNAVLKAYPEKGREITEALRAYRQRISNKVAARMRTGVVYEMAYQLEHVSLADAESWLKSMPEVARERLHQSVARSLDLPREATPLEEAKAVDETDPAAAAVSMFWAPGKKKIYRVSVHRPGCYNIPVQSNKNPMRRTWFIHEADLTRVLEEMALPPEKINTNCGTCNRKPVRTVLETPPVVRYRVVLVKENGRTRWVYPDTEAEAIEEARRRGVDSYERVQTVSVPPEGASAPRTVPVIHVTGDVSPEAFWTSYGWLPVELHISRPTGRYTVAVVGKDGPTFQEDREACGCP